MFDLRSDPWEMKDIAGEPGQRERLEQMRAAVANHMRETVDLGLFPRSMREKEGKVSLYEWVRTTKFPVNDLIAAAEMASSGDPANVGRLTELLKSDRPALRFWGASGFTTLAAAGRIKEAPAELVAAAKDANDEIAATAAEALCHLGRGAEGLPILLNLLKNGSGAAGSSLEELRDIAKPLIPELEKLENQQPARSILITLGKLPHDRFFGPKAHEEGLRLNAQRLEWRYPSPDPAENARRPKEAESGD